MYASPQPTVVPITSTGVTSTMTSGAPSAVHDEDRSRTEGHDESTSQIPRHGRQSADGRVVRIARPADEREVDVAHRRGEPFERVVPESEEVGRDLEMLQRSVRGLSLEFTDDTLHEDGMEASRARDEVTLLGGHPVVRPDAVDEMVHPGLSIGLDLDVDRRGGSVADDRSRAYAMP